MGETRTKRPTKKSLKAQKGEHQDLMPEVANLAISAVSVDALKHGMQPFVSTVEVVPSPCTKSSKTSDASVGSMSSVISSPNSPQSPSVPEFKYDPSIIEIKQTATKGIAIFANRRIVAGTIILAEAPLIRLTRKHEEMLTADAVLDSSYTHLSKETQKQFLSLFDSQKATFSRVKSIYYSNCYNLARCSDYGGSCIGLIASRINHSCIPNVQFSFRDSEGENGNTGEGLMLFHAIKTIPRGKEIVSNYDTVFDTRKSRRRKQLLHYRFQCECEACEQATEFWARSDERRMDLIQLRKQVRAAEEDWSTNKNNFNAEDIETVMRKLEKMENVMLKEGLTGDCLVNVHKSLVKWAERTGVEDLVTKWRERVLRSSLICYGETSTRVQELRAKLWPTLITGSHEQLG